MKNSALAWVGLVAIFIAAGQSRAVTTYQTGFNQTSDVSGSNYTLGSIVGQNGWTKVNAGNDNCTIVSDNYTYAGDGCLSAGPDTGTIMSHASGIDRSLPPNGTIVISMDLVGRLTDGSTTTGKGRVNLTSSQFGKIFGWAAISGGSAAYGDAEMFAALDSDTPPFSAATAWAGCYTGSGYINNSNWTKYLGRHVGLTITITPTTITYYSINRTATDAGLASTVTASYAWTPSTGDIRDFGDLQITGAWGGHKFVMGIDDLKIEYIAPIGSVTGTVAPAGYTGSLQDVGLRLDLRQGSTTTSQWVFPDATGKFTVANLPAGTYDAIGVKANGWLRKNFVSQTVSTGTALNLGTINLVSGDANGSNAVDNADLAIILANMDLAGDSQ